LKNLHKNYTPTLADYFKSDSQFCEFLKHLAEDEAWHSQVMHKAAAWADAADIPAPTIRIDSATKARIETPFFSARKDMDSRRLPKAMLLSRIIEAEYSEWNEIFLYVVNVLKDRNKMFAAAASKIHQHRKLMENFLATVPEGDELLEEIRNLPNVWQEKILIVEYDPSLKKFFSDTLSKEGATETTANAAEGFNVIREYHYDIILFDLEVPAKSVMDFFRQAVTRDPGLRERILFLTAAPTVELFDFFAQEGLRYFVKPVMLQNLQTSIREIIGKTRTAL
jgi:CheY-like chemotaxis protein